MDDFGPRFLGVVLILIGISLWINPQHYSTKYGVTFNFTDINIPCGFFLVALGVGFIWTTYRKK
jgi:hypothetical protein